jgi:hypothetical protein
LEGSQIIFIFHLIFLLIYIIYGLITVPLVAKNRLRIQTGIFSQGWPVYPGRMVAAPDNTNLKQYIAPHLPSYMYLKYTIAIECHSPEDILVISPGD